MFPMLALALPAVGTLVLILVVACLAGLVFWAAQKYLDIPSPFKGIILFILILIFVIWVASVLRVG